MSDGRQRCYTVVFPDAEDLTAAEMQPSPGPYNRQSKPRLARIAIWSCILIVNMLLGSTQDIAPKSKKDKRQGIKDEAPQRPKYPIRPGHDTSAADGMAALAAASEHPDKQHR